MRFLCGGLALTHKKGRFSERPRPGISPVERGLRAFPFAAIGHGELSLVGRPDIQGFRVSAHRIKSLCLLPPPTPRKNRGTTRNLSVLIQTAVQQPSRHRRDLSRRI